MSRQDDIERLRSFIRAHAEEYTEEYIAGLLRMVDSLVQTPEHRAVSNVKDHHHLAWRVP